MFPFVIKGKVILGLRRDFHLSTVSLEERLNRRLVSETKAEKKRREIAPTSGSWEILTGGVSRLLKVGFLSTVNLRRIKILALKDHLAAAYVIDATATALLSVVVIPLIIGTALIYNSKLSTAHAIILLLLLVVTTWGLDVGMLVILLRHEIRMIATEVRTVMMQPDTPAVERHHLDLDAPTLLASAYYYQDNSLTKRSYAYLNHLITVHPESQEAELAQERLRFLKQDPYYRTRPKTEEERADERARNKRRFWRSWKKADSHGRIQAGTKKSPTQPALGKSQEKRRLLPLPGFLRVRISRKKEPPISVKDHSKDREIGSNHGSEKRRWQLRIFRSVSRDERNRRKREKRWLYGPSATRRKLKSTGERKLRKRWWQPPWFKLRPKRAEKRLAKRHSKKYQDHFATYPTGQSSKRRKLIRLESRKQRQARKRWESWTYGPGPPKGTAKSDAGKSRTPEGRMLKQRRWNLPGLNPPKEKQPARSRQGPL